MGKYLSVVAFLLVGLAASRADDADKAGTKFLAPTNDVGIASDGTIQGQDSYEVRVGEFRAPGGQVYILPFRLPKLPAGQHFLTIHLRIQLHGLNNAGGLANADLYGLGVRDDDKSLPADYYQGAKPDPKATLLVANFLTPASPVRKNSDTGPFVETSAEGDAALTKYFNDFGAKDGMAGKYLFLRISYDVDTIPDGNNAYMVLTTGADGDNETPLLTYTVGPL